MTLTGSTRRVVELLPGPSERNTSTVWFPVAEIKAALETKGPFLCTVHANEEVSLDEDTDLPA